jgi:hypothetical protein
MARGRHLAVIPARGGSQGLERKNLRRLDGLSLVARAALLACQVRAIREVIVSTDSPEIADEARRHGAQVPFLRPAKLSGGNVPMACVLAHSWEWYRNQGDVADGAAIILLQPTSPMRRLRHIEAAIAMFERLKAEGRPVSVVQTVSLVPPDVRPDEFVRLNADGTIAPAHLPPPSRQLVYRNGAAIVVDPDNIDALTFGCGETHGLLIEEPLVSIDNWTDLLRVASCGRPLGPTNPL